MKKIKTEKGITLVALIITIVVLLILAVVTITSVKDTRIIGHAENASQEHVIGDEKERIQLAYSNYKINKYKPRINADQDELEIFFLGENKQGKDFFTLINDEKRTNDTLIVDYKGEEIEIKLSEATVNNGTNEIYLYFSYNGYKYKLTVEETNVAVMTKELEVIEAIESNESKFEIEGATVRSSEGFFVNFKNTNNLYSVSKDGIVEYIGNINHDTIIEILENLLNNRTTEAEALQRLKDEGAIEEDIVSLMDGGILVEQLYDDDYSKVYPYIYFKKINALYKISETDSGRILSYVDSSFAYQQVKCIRITRETLEDIFLSGKELPADLIPTNISGFSELENEKKFLDYIVNNSNGRIKNIGGIDHISPSYSSYIISLADLLLVDENGEETILELIDENGEKTTALFGENSGHSVELKVENGIITSINVHSGT